MVKGDIVELYKFENDVFNIKDIALIWKENNFNNLKSKIKYYIDKGKLFKIKRGLYAKTKDYDISEAANKLYFPSYVSFETILLKEGIIFNIAKRYFGCFLSKQIKLIEEK